MRLARNILVAAALSAATSLVIGTAAFAKTTPLNPSQIGKTAEGFEDHDCSGPLAHPPAATGWDGWHFVLPPSAGDNFNSLTITFSDGVVAVITSRNPASPSTGSGFTGFISATGRGDFRDAFIFTTPTGRSIVAGTSDTSGVDAQHEYNRFNLKKTCPGKNKSPSPTVKPSKSVTPSPSGTTAETTAPVPSGGAKTGAGGSQSLPWLAALTLLLLGAPIAISLYLRRRDEAGQN